MPSPGVAALRAETRILPPAPAPCGPPARAEVPGLSRAAVAAARMLRGGPWGAEPAGRCLPVRLVRRGRFLAEVALQSNFFVPLRH